MVHPTSCEVRAESVEEATKRGMVELGVDSPEDVTIEVLEESPLLVKVSRLAEAPEPTSTGRRKTRSTRTRKTQRRPSPKPTVVIDAATPAVATGFSPGIPASKAGLEPSRAKPRADYEPNEEDADVVEQTAAELLDATGLEYEFELEPAEYQRVFIQVPPRVAGALIGRRGATIDALEYILGRMASQRAGRAIPIQIDVNEYRSQRDDELREGALAAGARVLETGQDYHFEPMRPRERRVVHLAVKAVDGLETYTVGDGADRHIIISRLEGASGQAHTD